MRMMVFHQTGNLGDMMQSVALSRLLGKTTPFFRDQSRTGDPGSNDLGVAVGFLLGAQGYVPERTLFSGIWFPNNPSHLDWLRKTPWPVGARDPSTHRMLKAAGIQSVLVGCATLTLPRYSGPRAGTVRVDDGSENQLTHSIPPSMKPSEEWKLCLERLEIYRKASIVRTSRIHVALPCLAMGTMVRYVGPRNDRTSILDELCLPQDWPSAPDVTPLRNRYLGFLRTYLERHLEDGPPVMPDGLE